MENRLKILARILLAVYLVLVAYICFGHFEQLNIQNTIFGLPSDKIIHFLMFLPFPILSFLSFYRYRPNVWHAVFCIVIICIIGCLVAGATEIGQGLTSYRSEDIKDFYADSLAIGIGSLIVFIIELSIIKKKEAKHNDKA
jgi:VanZ family protein